jgi:hypothetical protein
MSPILNGVFRGFIRCRLSHDLFLSHPLFILPFDAILRRKVTDKQNTAATTNSSVSRVYLMDNINTSLSSNINHPRHHYHQLVTGTFVDPFWSYCKLTPLTLQRSGVKQNTHIHQVPRSRMVELYLHSHLRLHEMVLK